MVDHLDAECKAHFSQVVGWLDHLLVKYKINDRLVRGLDYYTRTAFEIVAKQLGAQNAVCGGGRYDDLVEEMGGKSVPAIGFAAGLERVVEILKAESRQSKIENRIGLFIATIGDEARQVGFDLLTKAREKGISADIDFQGKSLKAQMKAADRLGARYVYIIGDDELKNKSAVLKNMSTAEQKEVSFGELLSVFVK